jgi:hypothetical protein
MDTRLFPLMFTIAFFYLEPEEELAAGIPPGDRRLLCTVSARRVSIIFGAERS